jgi:hypothetical protein
VAFRDAAESRLVRIVHQAYEAASVPLVVFFLLYNRRIHAAYRMTWAARLRLGVRMYRNTRRVTTGISYRGHLAMAAKLLEIPPSTPGVVVECGCYKGGTTANLSLVCDIVGRDLIVYDSFEGLPAAKEGDRTADPRSQGWFRGELEEVIENVTRYGAVDRCTFRKGWFEDTLPGHTEPVVLCFLDVDFQASLNDCVLNLWSHLTPKGYVFLDECLVTDYCALFYSERFWRTHFDTTPPGLLGAGSGVGVGQFWVGPSSGNFGIDFGQPAQRSTSLAYTRRDLSGYWDYYPD